MHIQSVLSETLDGAAVETALRGHLLLECPLLNKGTAFPHDERLALGLLGLLPPTEETLEEQTARAYEAYQAKVTDLERHIYLRQLQDTNETLFYRLILDHLAEMMPIVYTPTVGLACERLSHIFRRPRGLFISYPEREHIDEILANAAAPSVEVIVVTDGERILGLGDQGVGGMGIPIGKLSLYTACGGIHPATTLPIVLDVGTNNPQLLADPLYIGWRHERVTGPEYDAFIERFVEALTRLHPRVLLQWEDFAQPHAGPLLDRYRDRLCTFNDDIQGTAVVTTATLLAAVAVTGSRLIDERIAILGAGSAGCGVAEQLVRAMVEEGLSDREARERFYLVDRPGLLHDGMTGLLAFQRRLAQPRERLASWKTESTDRIDLADVVRNVRPTILIGVSGQTAAFKEPLIRAMAEHVDCPIIFPLSNPTSRAEARPVDLIEWTHGRAIIATGSPFEDVVFDGRSFPVAQCNNSYIFPGLGLGILACGATRVSDHMLMAATRALAERSPVRTKRGGSLLPPLADSRPVSRDIAIAVATAAFDDGLATRGKRDEIPALIDAKVWRPRYVPFHAK
jgi:malate dehydrogenase (oxaloacetate-decarboxylating)